MSITGQVHPRYTHCQESHSGPNRAGMQMWMSFSLAVAEGWRTLDGSCLPEGTETNRQRHVGTGKDLEKNQVKSKPT